jgi:DNA-binding ferritin-like protein
MATDSSGAAIGSSTNPAGLPTEIQSTKPVPDHLRKIDQISALQDGIDSLSLSMFEALRGLRDAVAPESGNLGGGGAGGTGNSPNNTESAENDFEEFVQAYKNRVPEVLERVKKVSNVSPKKREDFIRIHAKLEMEKDAELVKKLAETVLQKSADIDRQVAVLPGMQRSRTEQMKMIEELLEKNRQATQKLEETYKIAEARRDQVRTFVRDHTCEALGILED